MEFDSEKRYYVYVWYYKDTKEVFYVGKGTGKRYKTRKRNNTFNEIVKNNDCDCKIIKNNLTEEQAFDLEIKTIANYRSKGINLINVLDGGCNPPSLSGIPKSEEAKAKYIASIKKFYEEHPERREEASKKFKDFLKTEKGKEFRRRSNLAKQNEEYRLKQSIKCKNANNTPEYIAKQKEIVKQMWKSEEYRESHCGKNNHRAQKVKQFDLDGSFICEYETITQASINTGVNLSKISAVCKGNRKTAGGYIWKYSTSKILVNKRKKEIKYNGPCSTPVIQYDKKGVFLKEYSSISDAVRVNNYNHRTNIIANLKGKTKTAYGYVWKYKQGNTVPSQIEV